MKEKIKLGLMSSVAVVALSSAPALATSETGNGSENPHNKVTICHATGSQSNPYVVNTPNANGDVSGHAGSSHQDGRDIIPPFEYNDNGTTKSFPGQNWDAQGQAILRNGCKAGGKGGGVTQQSQTPAATQVAANSTTTGLGQAAAPQAVAAQGGVSAGVGGAKATNTAAVMGLVGSVGAIVAGASRFVISKKLF